MGWRISSFAGFATRLRTTTGRFVWTRASPRHNFERAFTNLFFDKRLDAIPDLSKVIALDPKNWMAYNFRGELYRYWVKLAPAIADYKQAVALNPGFAQPCSPTVTWPSHSGRRGG